MFGGLLKGLGKALGGLGKAVGGFLGGPWGQLALTVAPMLFGRRGGGGGPEAQAAQASAQSAAQAATEMDQAAMEAAKFQRDMAQQLLWLANQIQIPPALAPTVFARLKAQAMSQQPQLPAGVVVPGLKELTQAKGLALAQQAGAQQQLADYDAQMRALAQRANLISGAAGLVGGGGGVYQQLGNALRQQENAYRQQSNYLAQIYRQQQAGQLAGWAQLMPQIAQLFRKQQPSQLDVARSLGKFFRGW